MKIGLYTITGEAVVGGGFVLRNDVARAVLDAPGRHEKPQEGDHESHDCHRSSLHH